MIDLHLHSTFSDGMDTPSQLIDKAEELKLKAIAITDQDTIGCIQEFLSYGEDKNIILIPGIEISIRHEPERELEDVHILGLNIDHNSSKLITMLNKQIEGRLNQKKQICNRLREELGYDITYEERLSMLYSNPEWFGSHGGFIDSICLNDDAWLVKLLEEREKRRTFGER